MHNGSSSHVARNAKHTVGKLQTVLAKNGTQKATNLDLNENECEYYVSLVLPRRMVSGKKKQQLP
jgi:hypothetical protein